jgi:molybdate transport system permease protein
VFRASPTISRPWRTRPELPFLLFLVAVLLGYAGLLVLLVAANALTVSPALALEVLQNPDIRHSIRLTFLTCTATAILSVFIAIPIGYLLSRFQFRGRALLDTLLDIPILLPPLVVGLSLLILFNRISPSTCCLVLAATLGVATTAGFIAGLISRLRCHSRRRRHERSILVTLAVLSLALAVAGWLTRSSPGSLESFASGRLGLAFTFHPLGIVLAQLPVAAAFAIRTLRTTFDQINPRYESVALTLGCNRGQAFTRVVLPLAGRGILAAGTLAWARALGEFGPVLVFAGATRGRTEVLATSVFLEINIGNLPGAAAISLLMILIAVATLLVVRLFARDRSPATG